MQVQLDRDDYELQLWTLKAFGQADSGRLSPSEIEEWINKTDKFLGDLDTEDIEEQLNELRKQRIVGYASDNDTWYLN